MNGGSQRHSLSISVCVFMHWTPNNPELIRCLEEFRELLPTRVLHSADRFRAGLHHTLWSKFLFPIMNGEESETLSVNICLRVHHMDTKQTLNYPLLGGISRALAHTGAALG
ncbi:hypothetical protein TcYC6_0003660 [Trypanosoma cruzi]|nr:hypothetical protein TcYC6_0003660 [Trypanosoma cruzi]